MNPVLALGLLFLTYGVVIAGAVVMAAREVRSTCAGGTHYFRRRPDGAWQCAACSHVRPHPQKEPNTP